MKRRREIAREAGRHLRVFKVSVAEATPRAGAPGPDAARVIEAETEARARGHAQHALRAQSHHQAGLGHQPHLVAAQQEKNGEGKNRILFL